nr:uncharacterized protein LOC110370152 [Helicoverpa armigera]
MKFYSIELFLGFIILSCQVHRYGSMSPDRIYISRREAYTDPGHEIIELLGSRRDGNYGHRIHHGLTVPYVERAQYLRSEDDSLLAKKLYLTNDGEIIEIPPHIGPKVNFADIDKLVLDRLKEEDRNFLEANLTPAERQALLIKVQTEGDNFSLNENRFGGYLTNLASDVGAGAAGFIGKKLAGPLGGQLGVAMGSYLVFAMTELLGNIKGKIRGTSVTSNGTTTSVRTVTMDDRRRINRYI